MKKMFAIVCTAVMLSGMMTGLPAAAKETAVSVETAGGEISVMSEGLIYAKSLSISKSGTTLYINASTTSLETMKTIGFKDIVVEYSTDNANWRTYNSSIPDITNSSATSCYISDYAVSVTNGYYYRVTLKHYAKATGLFGSSQTIANTSNVVK